LGKRPHASYRSQIVKEHSVDTSKILTKNGNRSKKKKKDGKKRKKIEPIIYSNYEKPCGKTVHPKSHGHWT
jgi:hypothetical protein